MYALFAVSLLIIGNAAWFSLKLWLAGTSDNTRFHGWLRRFLILASELLGQRRVNRKAIARAFHAPIFFGFLVLTFTTTMVLIDHDFGIEIYRGRFYLAVTLLSDLFGLALLVGLFLAIHRRYLSKPDEIHRSHGDSYMLVILVLLVVQGFLLEALRIHATKDPWALYSPVGYVVSRLFWPFGPEASRDLHFVVWWFHTVTVFVFIALLPYSKFIHIFTSSANLFFRNLARPKGAIRYPGDIEQLLESSALSESAEFRIGVSHVGDLSWKQRLDLDACTACGRCQEVCPAYNSGKVLSPKWLILDTRNHLHMLELSGKLHGGGNNNGNGPAKTSGLESLHHTLASRFSPLHHGAITPSARAANPLVQQALENPGENETDPISGTVMDENVFWACTTCRACMEACPVGIEHVDYILDVRRSMALMEGRLPNEARTPLRSLETRGNPFGDPAERPRWADGLPVKIVKPGDKVEVLYWVGCISAYDKRKQAIARAMVTILNASQISWGMLGAKENCTGDPARRLGEENLFQTLAKKNLEILSQVSFETMVANCPHCFNTMKHEYPQIGSFKKNGKPPHVIHHSEFIRELLRTKQIAIEDVVSESFTYHDPCYLGRYNDVYDAPRDTLVQLGGSKGKLNEMSASREKGLCCGAGGGHYWFDMKQGERVNVIRANQVHETGAKLVGTACPFCMQMLEDGMKLTGREEIRVRDIAELVAEGLENQKSETGTDRH